MDEKGLDEKMNENSMNNQHMGMIPIRV